MAVSDLLKQRCVPCNEDTIPLSFTEISELTPHVPEWTMTTVDDDIPCLKREIEFKDFDEALQFTNKVGEIAEKNGHHPRITTEYGKVTVEWWTYAINNLHSNDFIMAIKVNDLLANWDVISGRKDVVQQASESSFPASDPPSSW